MMKDAVTTIFGTYAPIDGCADWGFIAGVILFAICLYSLFRLIGVIFK